MYTSICSACRHSVHLKVVSGWSECCYLNVLYVYASIGSSFSYWSWSYFVSWASTVGFLFCIEGPSWVWGWKPLWLGFHSAEPGKNQTLSMSCYNVEFILPDLVYKSSLSKLTVLCSLSSIHVEIMQKGQIWGYRSKYFHCCISTWDVTSAKEKMLSVPWGYNSNNVNCSHPSSIALDAIDLTLLK